MLISTQNRRTNIGLALIAATAAIAMGCGDDDSDNGGGSSPSGSSQTTTEASGPLSIPQAADLYIEIQLQDETDKNWSSSSDCSEWRSTAGAYGGEEQATETFIDNMHQLASQDPEYAPFKDVVRNGIVGQLYDELLSRCGIG